uniref:TATA box-binding protein-associated factor RNA polymerase I subunit B n=1 Tax=Phallusia mammillata TaxID=59560 RepID=A0A6F9DUW0_9ASCI|nr:TATA box-binding protein-associated factor RNA polymerase I subunit B [Phallusia mammillata]
MPVCSVCDGETFDVVNGLYFCRLCSTQSQEVIEEELEYSLGDGQRALYEKRTKSKVDQGKPWYTVEGFQVILKAQVDALIKLGCTPKLSEIVQQIWLKYVHISGIACIDPHISQQKQILKSFRDEYLTGVLGGFPEAEETLPSTKRATVKLRLSAKQKKRKENSSDGESLDTDSFLNDSEGDETNSQSNAWSSRSDEEWFSLDSNYDSSDSGSEDAPKKEKRYRRPDKRDQKTRVIKSKVRTERSHMKFLNHKKLIAILFIGLQWCKELVTMGDLITWIKHGYLPFLDSVENLLPHMKLGDLDMNHFNLQYIPSYTQIITVSDQLVKFVSMPSVPDVDIMKLVARYVVQMNLPHGLVPFINMIKSDLNYRRNNIYSCPTYVPDLVAVSLVIIALKLLYGLNDKQEWDMDESVSACKHDSDKHTCNAFTWGKWSGYHLRRRGEARQRPAHCFVTNDVEEMRDIHSRQEHWDKVVLAACMTGKERTGKSYGTRGLREQMKTRCRVFEKICEEQGSSEEMERRGMERKFPFVFPKASPGDDMSQCCICNAVRMFSDEEHPQYVWYNTRYTRFENSFEKRDPAGRYHYSYDVSNTGEETFHDSYELMLQICVEFTCAPRTVIHETVQAVERAVVCPYLKHDVS